ncbi:proteasome-interacting protein cic1 [Neophaeococcomyces mojaviensis]|uniref:Proteasome-interacting protein cic1 n=1 Tax=Neophaeococcomyces mojaviensis TaxID=3383035 RepID=A0ACC2ZZJ8_9EURO|nr:proteasome-interacting protein cic1 [Knufia sp. JES_112]
MALTTHISQLDKTQTPYKIDPEQTLRASQALLRHVKAEVQRIQDQGGKRNLLAKDESDDDHDEEDAQPIWLNITTKTYTEDKIRLKPSKIPVPHSLNRNENSTICLITTDPQRAIKNVVADSAFPASLATRITRIIGFSKLIARYKSFEQRRQLLSEHDVFLADERIVGRLPKVLGKVFYKGTAKRPIPVSLAPKAESGDKPNKGSNAKVSKDVKQASVGSPHHVAKEVEKALTCVPVSLSPGHNIAIRVALDAFTAEQIRENVAAVANGVIDRLVVNGWRNVKSIHIKTSDSIAVPVWLAEDVFAENTQKALTEGADELLQSAGADADSEASSKKRKRKATTSRGPQSGERKKARRAEEAAREKDEAAVRKARLTSQKASVFGTKP